MTRWLLPVVLVVVLGLHARIAEACGVWTMEDHEKHLRAVYEINLLDVRTAKYSVTMLRIDDSAASGLRTVAKRKVVLDVKGDKLVKRGKPIATIGADGTVAFGKRVYTIELTNQHVEHGDFTAWDLSVKRGDKVILTSTEASALCAPMHRDPPATAAQMEDEVRRRVMFYLAWRETGM